MPSIIGEYLGGFIGNLMGFILFVYSYNYFVPIPISWNLIIGITIAFTLIFAPISYILKSILEEKQRVAIQNG